MRCYQHIGLKKEVYEWLRENVAVRDVVTHKCKNCGHEDVADELVILDEEHVDMFYGDGPTLTTYRLKTGAKVKEIVQAEPWSSGPIGFLCLELDDGKRLFEWSAEEIREMA